MEKLTKRQKKITAAMEALPDKMTPDEFEAMVCSVVSGSIGFEEVPAFLLYLHLKTARIQQELMATAKKETKH